MIAREKALDLLKLHIKNKNLIKHMLATEVVMKFLAEKFNQDIEVWSMAGLLHDLDYEYTVDDFKNHGYKTAELLKEFDLPEEMIHAIKAHAGHKDIERANLIDKAIYSVDPITGLIVAAVLMHPTKKLANLTVDFLFKRFKEKRFAAGANRDQIAACEELGLSLDEFMDISIKAMQSISKELGF